MRSISRLTLYPSLWHTIIMTDNSNKLKDMAHQIRGALAVLKVALQPGMLNDPDMRLAAETKLNELDQLTDVLDAFEN